MASEAETAGAAAAPLTDGIWSHRAEASHRPSTPGNTGLPGSSQITLPSTEVPTSPGAESFKTEANEDGPSASTVIPSSLTPPPSTQQPAAHAAVRRRPFSQPQSQQTNFCSPPATIQRAGDHRDVGSDYAAPEPQAVLEASADQLRIMMQDCLAEHQKLKMGKAHYKLQFNLLSMQADDDAKRAQVEHEMTRREVEALQTAEHSRQARRDLNSGSDSMQAKYFHLKTLFAELSEENDALNGKMKSAKNLIQQLQERCEQLEDDRQMYINRIRENRERFHMLTSPGGMFHGTLTPKHGHSVTHPQQTRPDPRPPPPARGQEDEGREHGLSALLQAMSQDNSLPSTPRRALGSAPRHGVGRHGRNSMSLSALPSTPLHSTSTRKGEQHAAALLPSADLVPQTEPVRRYSSKQFAVAPPTTPTRKRAGRQKSRESTISESDNEELARQAIESVTASHTQSKSRGSLLDSQEYSGSQASQAATELLRRNPRHSFDSVDDDTAEAAAALQAKLSSHLRTGAADKRKFSSTQQTAEKAKRSSVPPGPGKKQRVGLGIDFGRHT